ncbi:MAG: glycosyltransferase family 1 protein [Alphaproteobacteria bacterium]
MTTALPRADIVVDASNVTSGGVLGHLRGLLSEAAQAPFESILVIGGADQVDDFAGLHPRVQFFADPALGRCKWRRGTLGDMLDYLRLLARLHRWRNRVLPARATAARARLLLAANGILPRSGPPGIKTVAVSHNMLPFAPAEWPDLGIGLQRLRVMALRRAQMQSFRRADGLIFLSEHAKRAITAAAGLDRPAPGNRRAPRSTVAYLGIDHGLFHPPATIRQTLGDPIELLYVSSLDRYKHHVEVVRAIAMLKHEHAPSSHPAIRLHLAGWEDGASARRLDGIIDREALTGTVIRHGFLPPERLADLYRSADLFVFASTCENCPTILIEAMASGLPMACTAADPMTEIAGTAAVNFNARDPASIAQALRRLIADHDLRRSLADQSQARARAFTRANHAGIAWRFIGEIAGVRPSGVRPSEAGP